MEAISIPVVDVQERVTTLQSNKPAINIPIQQPTEQSDRDNTVNPLFTPINLENSAQHVP